MINDVDCEVRSVIRNYLDRHDDVLTKIRRLRLQLIKVRLYDRINERIGDRLTALLAFLNNSSSSAVQYAKAVSEDQDNVLRGLRALCVVYVRDVRYRVNERAVCSVGEVLEEIREASAAGARNS